MSGRDRMIGVVLGLLLGVVAVVLFVFLGGGASIDAPSIDTPSELTQPAPEQTTGGEGG